MGILLLNAKEGCGKVFGKPDMEKVKRRLMWDFRVEDESANFMERRTGYAFVVDVAFGEPRLSLYHITRFGSKCDDLDQQPPNELLLKALVEQGATLGRDGIYNINQELRLWIEEHIL